MTRSLLAGAAAGALVLGSAAGVAAAKPSPRHPAKPAPQTSVTLKTVSIKGHAPIDLAKAAPGAAIKLRATVRDAAKKVPTTETVDVTLAVYTKKVRGTKVAGTDSTMVKLALRPASANHRTRSYAGNAVLNTVWTADQLTSLKAALKPGDRAYACIATADLTKVDEKQSTIVKKRLSTVRDCVKVIDSSTTG